MPLPEPILDDLRFQRDLVDEARRRIIRYCPEWTDYNLSDPGITLIELFAWMTELTTYRLNRVPEKNYVRFLNMLGIELEPPSSARTELTFWLSTPFPIRLDSETVAIVPAGTSVATQRLEEEQQIIFTTDKKLRIKPPKLIQLRREEDFNKNYLPRLGIESFYTFSRGRAPQIGDTFYLGFDEEKPINGALLQLTFICEETQATGIRRDDPPLIWECSTGDGTWLTVAPSKREDEKDTTGGLNNPKGRMIFYLPVDMRPDQVHGKSAYWLRCRFEPRRPEQGKYTQSPRIRKIVAHTRGSTTWATHAVIIRDELLGRSDGEPGQIFMLKNSPVLTLSKGESLEVEETHDGEDVFIPWEMVEDFSGSTRYDKHYRLDYATGEISFGPSIRQADGTVHQYGRIPEASRLIRFSQYRHGGGVSGNLPPGKLQVLKTSLPYINRVTNLKRAEGGRDQEGIEEVKMRARREIRAQDRAVTADDFENLAKGASRSIARIHTRTPSKIAGPLPPGMVELLVVPAALDSIRAGDYGKLKLEEDLREKIRVHLDKYRLLTTTLNIREPRYLGVKVSAEIVASEFVKPELVRAKVNQNLRTFITPIDIEMDGIASDFLGLNWEGWPFGRDLYTSELFSLIQQVPGVKHVLDVQISYCEITPINVSSTAGNEDSDTTETKEEKSQDSTEKKDAKDDNQVELIQVEERFLEIPADTLICSLEHDIQVKFV